LSGSQRWGGAQDANKGICSKADRSKNFGPSCGLAPLLQALLTEAARLGRDSKHSQTDSASRSRVMTKITTEHLARGAPVYVRQSTSD
jgi:hypothetical protein